MITLDTLRTVLLSDQPYTKLDALVRSELSSGRRTRDIHDELHGMEDAVRQTPGFGEAAEDALRDTIDALAGFCPAKYAYHDADAASSNGVPPQHLAPKSKSP